MKYGGCTAKLRMDRVILEDSFFDETEYLCKIIAYDEEGDVVSGIGRGGTHLLFFGWNL